MADPAPDYSAVVSATGFLRPRASRSVRTFHDHLVTSRRILALLGAGLSASSGLPTYRGAGGLWRNYDATQLSTPAAFAADPALVWQFHLERRREVERAEPNAAHFALTELARKKKDFLALTMNVDDLSEKAGHIESQLCHLHGRLLDIKCTNCDLHLTGAEAENAIETLLDYSHALPLTAEDVPRCPNEGCDGMLRPGVVWFTESLPREILLSTAAWIENGTIDTMLVIGTSALVYPATAYVEAARKRGARVAVVDIAQEDPSLLGLEEQDWYFQGDAATVVPRILTPVTEELKA